MKKKTTPTPLGKKFYGRIENNPLAAKKKLTIVLVLALIYLTTITILFNSQPEILQAILAFPAALVVFTCIAGLLHCRHIIKKTEKLKERYSVKQRIKIAIVLIVILLIWSIVTINIVPYVIGGSILIIGIASIINMLIFTEKENILRMNDLPDPRDMVNIEQETVDVENFSWEEGDVKVDENKSSASMENSDLFDDLTDEEIVEFIKLKRKR